MPQLDQFTYFSQFLWLCVFFMTFYVLLYNDGLPKVSRILKLRAQLVGESTGQSAPSASVSDAQSVRECVNSSLSYLSSCVSKASKWCDSTVNEWHRVNLVLGPAYVSALGGMVLSQLVKHYVLVRSSGVSKLQRIATESTEASLAIDSAHICTQVYALRAHKSFLRKHRQKKHRK